MAGPCDRSTKARVRCGSTSGQIAAVRRGGRSLELVGPRCVYIAPLILLGRAERVTAARPPFPECGGCHQLRNTSYALGKFSATQSRAAASALKPGLVWKPVTGD
jgi:hypothetical protein